MAWCDKMLTPGFAAMAHVITLLLARSYLLQKVYCTRRVERW